jgi:hypothetical protein
MKDSSKPWDRSSRRCEGCEQFAMEMSWIGQDCLPVVPASRTRQQVQALSLIPCRRNRSLPRAHPPVS